VKSVRTGLFSPVRPEPFDLVQDRLVEGENVALNVAIKGVSVVA
jgi:hypothetical protein